MEQSVRDELRRWWAVLWAHAHNGTLPPAPVPGREAVLVHRDGQSAGGESIAPKVTVVDTVVLAPDPPGIAHVSPSNPWPLLGGVATAEPQSGPAARWAERAPTPSDAGDTA